MTAGTRAEGRGRARRGHIALKVIAGLVVVGAAVAGFKVVGGGEQGRARGSAHADLATVSEMSFDITTTATGELEARNQIELASKLETRSTIMEVVKEGTRVKKGDLLVRLNSEEIQRQIDSQRLEVIEAKNAKQSAESDLQNQRSLNESEVRKAELKVQLATLALEQWESGDLEKKYTELKLAIEQAERQFDRLSEKFRNSEELLAQGFLSKDERDLDEIALIDAESKLQTALLNEEIYWTYEFPKEREQKTSDLTEAQAELERVKTTNQIQLNSKTATLENRSIQLAAREKRLAELEEQLACCTILAPTEGLVVYATSSEESMWREGGSGPLMVGREVRPNETLIILPDTSEIMAKVRVHERLAGQVRSGQLARVKVEALGGAEFEGEVESIGVLAETVWRDNRKEYTVRIAIKRGALMERLKPTGGCEAEIRLASVDNVLAVPLQAVFSDGPVRFVFVPDGAKFHRVPIKQGQYSKSFVEIAAGLNEGQRVLLREPGPAEVLRAAWNPAELKLVGLEVNEKGEPVSPANAGWGDRAGGGENARSRGRGRPGGQGGGQDGQARPGDQGTSTAPAPKAEGEPAGGDSKPAAETAQATEATPTPTPAPTPAPTGG